MFVDKQNILFYNKNRRMGETFKQFTIIYKKNNMIKEEAL